MRERFQRALDALQDNSVITSHQRVPSDLSLPFQDERVIIQPPQALMEEYNGIRHPREPGLGERVSIRINKGSTDLLRAAEQIKIMPNRLSEIVKVRSLLPTRVGRFGSGSRGPPNRRDVAEYRDLRGDYRD
jgi:hypothetical protein